MRRCLQYVTVGALGSLAIHEACALRDFDGLEHSGFPMRSPNVKGRYLDDSEVVESPAVADSQDSARRGRTRRDASPAQIVDRGTPSTVDLASVGDARLRGLKRSRSWHAGSADEEPYFGSLGQSSRCCKMMIRLRARKSGRVEWAFNDWSTARFSQQTMFQLSQCGPTVANRASCETAEDARSSADKPRSTGNPITVFSKVTTEP